MLKQRDWSPLQKEILAEHFGDLDLCKERRKRLYRLIAAEMSAEPLMLRSMKVLGVGLINAFALLAVIGDVRRFQRPEKLVAYIGLNPGRRQSGTSKNIKLGVGKRGRGDIRHLLIQGAQAVLRNCRATLLGQWGWKLFARKGNRNRRRLGSQTPGPGLAYALGQPAHRVGNRQKLHSQTPQAGRGVGRVSAPRAPTW